MHDHKCHELKLQIKELEMKNEMLNKVIQKNQDRDRIRLMLASESGDETLRYLVDKYISKPSEHQKEM